MTCFCLSIHRAKERGQRESRSILFGIEESRGEFLAWVVEVMK